MIGRLLKNGYKELQKTLPKIFFKKSLKNMKKKEKKISFPKKACQKKSLKKVLQRKKNKPYIVTHWHASLNVSYLLKSNPKK